MGSAGDNSANLDSQESRLDKFCLDNASVCALRLNRDGRILYANRKACESLGYSREELLGMSVSDIDPMVTPEMWPDAWRQISTEQNVTVEGAHRRKDGTVFPVEVTATYLEFEGRGYSMALIKDITQRKHLSESLRLSQFMFDKASFGIFLARASGHIADVNDHACRYLGYTKAELCRMHILDIDRGNSPEENAQLWRQLQKEGVIHFESLHRRKDGTEIPVAITGNLFEFNNKLYSVSFVQDISDWKEAKKQRRKMEAQMRETQKMEALGTLAGGIAHDFNNILAAILGFTELAQLECPTGSNAKQYVSQISQAGRRAKDLVQQILTFSRQSRSEKGPLDISRAIEEALKLIKATLSANIEIREDIPSNLAPVFADETQIHQVVMNLCTNARHAMNNTGGTLDVSLKAVAIQEQDAQNYPGMAPGDYLKLSIADTGPGIAPNLINRIFEPYFTTKPTGEGTGLGLSTVHGIVQDHSGSIKVYSEPGVGTTFHIFLPVVEASLEAAAKQPEQLPTGSERILFVDDEKPLIDLGRALLERLGYRVETRASSIDAIEAFRTDPQKYDLIITDMAMPKMSGDELAREMKAIRSDIPIILCSGFSDRIDARVREAIGVSAFLMKPVTYADLAKTVRMALGAE